MRTPARAREVALSRTLEALRQPRQEEELLEQAIPTTGKKNAGSLEILCQTLRSQQRLEDAGAPGVVPETQRPPAFFSGENFQLVRRLFLAAGDEVPRAVVFCTVEKGNARNWISAQVAELLTYHTHSSVCIVDADVANPSLHTYFGVENSEGLAQAVLERGSVQEFSRPVGPSGLRLISAGTLPPGADCNSLIGSGRLDARISELRAGFGYVVVDAPPATSNCVAGSSSSSNRVSPRGKQRGKPKRALRPLGVTCWELSFGGVRCCLPIEWLRREHGRSLAILPEYRPWDPVLKI